MSEPTHVFDLQGEVIIILQCPDYEFASWNEYETEREPIKPHANEGKHWSYSGKPILPIAETPAEEPPAEQPPAPEGPATFDEQLEEVYPYVISSWEILVNTKKLPHEHLGMRNMWKTIVFASKHLQNI